MSFVHATFKAGYISVMEAGSGKASAAESRDAIADAFATLMQSTIASITTSVPGTGLLDAEGRPISGTATGTNS